MIDWNKLLPPEPESEADYATLRFLGRTTIGRSFPLQFGSTADLGKPARTVWQILSENFDISPNVEGDEELTELHQSPAGRVQLKARIVRDRGRVCEIRFERVRGAAGTDASLERLLVLDEEASGRLIELCVALRGIDPSGDETVKIDEDLLAAVLSDPGSIAAVYARDPDQFRNIIENDIGSTDVIALASRRNALVEFRALLEEPQTFEEARAGGSAEAVWQRYFEANPWVLGVGLSGHLFTAWDPNRLERSVAGSTIADVGKRVDALLTTSGAIRSFVLAEIKRHDDELVEGQEYRSGCWSPSRAVAGGVAQAQITADRARDDIGRWLAVKDEDGYPTGESVFYGNPRSYLIVGRLSSLTSEGRAHEDKFRSFELFRRGINAPEILTYDEVLARAEWSLAQTESGQIVQ